MEVVVRAPAEVTAEAILEAAVEVNMVGAVKIVRQYEAGGRQPGPLTWS